MRSTTTISTLTLSIGLAFLCSTASAGPPLICHPIDIGKQASLPFGTGPFELGDLARDAVVPKTVELLDASTDVFVHIETLRRAYLYLDQRGDGAAAARERDRLIARLGERALDAAAEEGRLPSRDAALRWLDVGYFLAILDQGPNRGTHPERAARYLDVAGRLAPNDAGVHFAIANASVDGANRSRYLDHLQRAVALAAESDTLARTNLLRVAARYDRSLATERFEELRQRLDAKRLAGGGKGD